MKVPVTRCVRKGRCPKRVSCRCIVPEWSQFCPECGWHCLTCGSLNHLPNGATALGKK